MKKQILVIHGGETFNSYENYLNYLKSYEIDFEKIETRTRGWKRHLQEDLGNDFEVIQPQMPSPRNAKYTEWKIWVEKYFPFLRDNITLIGNSLGGIFWTKYLSENKFPVKISQLHLIAAPFDNNDDISEGSQSYDLIDFNLSGGLSEIERQTENIFLYYSKDDPCVPFEDLEKYGVELPKAKKVIFENKGHFALEEFPELLERIR